MTLRVPAQSTRVRNSTFILPSSKQMRAEYNDIIIEQIIPERVNITTLKEIRIVPCLNGRYYRIQYIYMKKASNQDKNKRMSNDDRKRYLGIDLGVDNFAACLPSTGERGFLIDGRYIKIVNQFTDKKVAYLRSRLSENPVAPSSTRRMDNILKHHENVVRDFVFKSARYVIDYCIEHGIDCVVIGVNKEIKQCSGLGRAGNGHFQRMPFSRFRKQLAFLCSINGIEYIEQEESSTSVASFLDGDVVPVYGEHGAGGVVFSGSRVHRGLYESADGCLVNADLNGAANIVGKFLCGGGSNKKRKGNTSHDDDIIVRGGLCSGLRVGPVRVRVV